MRTINIFLFIAALSAALASSLSAQTPSSVWGSSKLLILGEEHTNALHGRTLLHDLPALKAAGMQTLAIEIPAFRQMVLNRFVAGNHSAEWLAKNLFEVELSNLPHAYRLRIEILEWARNNGIRLAAIDAGADLFAQIGAAASIARRENLTIVNDPDADEQFKRMGAPFSSLKAADAARRFWRLWINARTQAMAKSLAALANHHDGRIVALVGNLHVEFGHFRTFMKKSGADVESVAAEGIEDYLPEHIRSQTQSVLRLGGFNTTNVTALIASGQLHPIEAMLFNRGNTAVSIRSLTGVGSVDSVIFNPITSFEGANP